VTMAAAGIEPCRKSSLPPPRESTDLEVDPRLWGAFSRCLLVNGKLTADSVMSPEARGEFNRTKSEFTGEITVAESGRYHLFVSGVCPWASGVRAVWSLLGLESVIDLEVADGQSDHGWVYVSGTRCRSFADRSHRSVRGAGYFFFCYLMKYYFFYLAHHGF